MESNSNQSQSESRKRRTSRFFKLGAFLLVLAIVIFVLILILKGKETTTGEFPNVVKNEALTCKKANTTYSKINALSSSSQEIAVTMIFIETTSLNRISLDYTLYYDSFEASKRAEASAHAQFSAHLAEDHFSFTEFTNKFAPMKDRLKVSVYGGPEDLTSNTRASYFMLDAEKSTLETLEDFREAYETEGFKCTSTADE